jgi:hypothetical protein
MDNEKSQIFTQFVCTVEIKSQSQTYVLLGEFTATHPAKGFAVEFGPESRFIHIIDTYVTQQGTTESYRLTLHITNPSKKSISAKVWKMV